MVQYIKNTKERLYVVGLVGPFGSGCSYVAEKIVENHGYEYLSLSAVLREEYKKEKGVEQEPFESVTYNGYFRLMEVLF